MFFRKWIKLNYLFSFYNITFSFISFFILYTNFFFVWNIAVHWLSSYFYLFCILIFSFFCSMKIEFFYQWLLCRVSLLFDNLTHSKKSKKKIEKQYCVMFHTNWIELTAKFFTICFFFIYLFFLRHNTINKINKKKKITVVYLYVNWKHDLPMSKLKIIFIFQLV